MGNTPSHPNARNVIEPRVLCSWNRNLVCATMPMKRTANVPQRTPMIVAPCREARMIAHRRQADKNAKPKDEVGRAETAIAAISSGALRAAAQLVASHRTARRNQASPDTFASFAIAAGVSLIYPARLMGTKRSNSGSGAGHLADERYDCLVDDADGERLGASTGSSCLPSSVCSPTPVWWSSPRRRTCCRRRGTRSRSGTLPSRCAR